MLSVSAGMYLLSNIYLNFLVDTGKLTQHLSAYQLEYKK